MDSWDPLKHLIPDDVCIVYTRPKTVLETSRNEIWLEPGFYLGIKIATVALLTYTHSWQTGGHERRGAVIAKEFDHSSAHSHSQ